jgi:hypothetical protein
VITEAGNHERVAGLVFIAAFAPDAGESVSTLIGDPPPGAPVPPILPPQDGFLFLGREKFAASFAADVPAREAAFMADSQVPWGVEALDGTLGEPAPSGHRDAVGDPRGSEGRRLISPRLAGRTLDVLPATPDPSAVPRSPRTCFADDTRA